VSRIGGVTAIGGAVTLFVATLFHPMSADPNDPVAAFTEYAADRLWVASHLGQFLGVALLCVSLVALGDAMEAGLSAACARVGVVGTAASLAVAAALQAADGVALKVAVDRWMRAGGEDRLRAFEGAFAVRQIEIGLASLLSVLFGLTIITFGVAMWFSGRFPKWLSWMGLLGGLGALAAGVVQAYTGFSTSAMNVGMPANTILLVWAVAVGTYLWRLAPLQP
jgi:Domain of unknown function (DUF4386)